MRLQSAPGRIGARAEDSAARVLSESGKIWAATCAARSFAADAVTVAIEMAGIAGAADGNGGGAVLSIMTATARINIYSGKGGIADFWAILWG